MKILLTVLIAAISPATTNPNGFYGIYDHETFWYCIFYAIIGHALVTFLDVSTRNVSKPGTPTYFSWATFAECNWKRILRNVILIYLAVRFCPQLSGKQLTDFWALIAGTAIDGVFVLIKNARKMFPKTQD